MLNNFAFTLYEMFGYILPGGITLLGLCVLDWAFFVPSLPLGISTFQAGIVTWVCVVVASYLLGHASQAVGNIFIKGVETGVLGSQHGSAPHWMKERARQTAVEILNVHSDQLEPLWVFRTLDEYTVQVGKAGDRDIFIYREGFYRGTAVALFFLSATLIIRMLFAGCSIQFSKGLFLVSRSELLITALTTTVVGLLFIRRFHRFAEYRITRAVLAALISHRRLTSSDFDKDNDNKGTSQQE
jgi:hypothetical protein